MRLAATIGAVLASACVEAVSEDLPGQLVQVEVVSLGDDCAPARWVGDGGRQFLGLRPDGGALLTVAQTVQYGPLPDGGLLDGTALVQVPNPAAQATLGLEAACTAVVGALASADGGYRLEQRLPGALECPSGPRWLPRERCESTRLLRLEPLGPCSLRCVRLGQLGDVSCDC